MRNRRRTRLLRRLVLGFAVAALAASAAQARVDQGGSAQSEGGSIVIRGDDKVLAPPSQPLVIRGDDKVIVRPNEPVVIHGDDKLIQPFEPAPALVGDQDERYAPTSGFSWGDALVGAAAGFGLALLAFGVFKARRHLSRPAMT